jgi:hypothetical protein
MYIGLFLLRILHMYWHDRMATEALCLPDA